ncbi:hypothetical protein TWF696_008547 [Orbilia brochopaga]|uniref:Uncharacterized protein n=1 Tax=Orbilia brochopaga TaxID=3140254 RepID=A0AAV9UJX8_9PEZI
MAPYPDGMSDIDINDQRQLGLDHELKRILRQENVDTHYFTTFLNRAKRGRSGAYVTDGEAYNDRRLRHRCRIRRRDKKWKRKTPIFGPDGKVMNLAQLHNEYASTFPSLFETIKPRPGVQKPEQAHLREEDADTSAQTTGAESGYAVHRNIRNRVKNTTDGDHETMRDTPEIATAVRRRNSKLSWLLLRVWRNRPTKWRIYDWHPILQNLTAGAIKHQSLYDGRVNRAFAALSISTFFCTTLLLCILTWCRVRAQEMKAAFDEAERIQNNGHQVTFNDIFGDKSL